MDKSRICMSRTINLAKQKDLKKTNMLLYEPPARPPPPNPPTCAVPPISAPPAKRIRICTGAELKKMCRPPPITCPQDRVRVGFIGRLLQLLGFGLKAGVAATLVYWTWEAGLWGDSEETEMFYTNVCRMMYTSRPRQSELSEACEVELELIQVPPPPDDPCAKPPFNKERAMHRAKETWNHTVTNIFGFVVGFPSNVVAWYKKITQPEQCTPVKKK